jgi:hypothetical protein
VVAFAVTLRSSSRHCAPLPSFYFHQDESQVVVLRGVPDPVLELLQDDCLHFFNRFGGYFPEQGLQSFFAELFFLRGSALP